MSIQPCILHPCIHVPLHHIGYILALSPPSCQKGHQRGSGSASLAFLVPTSREREKQKVPGFETLALLIHPCNKFLCSPEKPYCFFYRECVESFLDPQNMVWSAFPISTAIRTALKVTKSWEKEGQYQRRRKN